MSKMPDHPPPYGFQHPQQAQYIPQQQAPVQTVTVQPQVVHVAGQVGPEPQITICASCHQQVRTRVASEATTRTHLMALLLAVLCCWPCVCVPYCMDSCKNQNHYCPNCNSFLGTYQQ